MKPYEQHRLEFPHICEALDIVWDGNDCFFSRVSISNKREARTVGFHIDDNELIISSGYNDAIETGVIAVHEMSLDVEHELDHYRLRDEIMEHKGNKERLRLRRPELDPLALDEIIIELSEREIAAGHRDPVGYAGRLKDMLQSMVFFVEGHMDMSLIELAGAVDREIISEMRERSPVSQVNFVERNYTRRVEAYTEHYGLNPMQL